MTQKRLKRPRDPIALAKMIGDIATGRVDDRIEDHKNPHAVALGKLGGRKGGKARADALSKEERQRIALRAAERRWGKRSEDT